MALAASGAFETLGSQSGLLTPINPADLATLERVIDVIPRPPEVLAAEATPSPLTDEVLGAGQVSEGQLARQGLANAIALLEWLEVGGRLPADIEELYPGAAATLASMDIYTTMLPQHPGQRWEGRGRRKTESILGQKGDRVQTQLLATGLPEFTQAGDDIGPALAIVLGQTAQLGADRVHIVDPDNGYDGTVTVGETVFATPSQNTSLEPVLEKVLAGTLGKPGHVRAADDREAVKVFHADEYDARDSESGTFQLMKEWFLAKTHTTFPNIKDTLQELENRGFRFRPEVRRWLVAVRDGYHVLARNLQATYGEFVNDEWREHPEKHPDTSWRLDPLTQSIAPYNEAWRNIINGGRPDGYHNRESRPREGDPELLISAGLETLTRDIPEDQRGSGPGYPRPLSRGEKFARWKAEVYAKVRERPGSTAAMVAIKLAGGIVGGGSSIVEFMLGGAANLIPGGKHHHVVREWGADRRAWRAEEVAFDEALPSLQYALGGLRRAYDALPPDPDSEQ